MSVSYAVKGLCPLGLSTLFPDSSARYRSIPLPLRTCTLSFRYFVLVLFSTKYSLLASSAFGQSSASLLMWVCGTGHSGLCAPSRLTTLRIWNVPGCRLDVGCADRRTTRHSCVDRRTTVHRIGIRRWTQNRRIVNCTHINCNNTLRVTPRPDGADPNPHLLALTPLLDPLVPATLVQVVSPQSLGRETPRDLSASHATT